MQLGGTTNLGELAQTMFGVAGFALLLLPPGYVFSYLTDLQGFRSMRRSEQTLWSLTMSLPLALLGTNLLGRIFGPHTVPGIFVAIAFVALALAAGPGRFFVQRPPSCPGYQRAVLAGLGLAFLVSCGVMVALLDVHIGQRVFLPATLYDWSVRVPLVRSALQIPQVPPVNPLSSQHGEIVSMRYYYFWSVLCGVPGRALGISAHNVLAASVVWSLLAFCSALILTLKYLAAAGSQIRLWSLTLLLPLATIGLDILPTLEILLNPHGHLYLDMEWWRDDRTPSFLTSVLYAPHHAAGMACNLLGFLIVVTTARDGETSRQRASNTQLGLRALAAGLCFGACAGTSTFGSLVFTFVCLLWTVELLHKRQWLHIAMLAAAGIVAYLGARPFLHDLRSTDSAASGFMALAWRSNGFAQMHLSKLHLLLNHPVLSFGLRQVFILLMDFFELGFFFFVLIDRWKQDRARVLTPGERGLWTILLATGFAAFFFSSVVTKSVNDLGMNAGETVRLVLVLWSVPWLLRAWPERRHLAAMAQRKRLWWIAAMGCLVLGLAGQAYGLVMNRFYFPLFESRIIDRPIDALTRDRLSYRIGNIEQAYAALNKALPMSAHIQYNPLGRMSPVMSYFSNRQVAASDGGCGTAFGGNYSECPPIEKMLTALYGSTASPVYIHSTPTYFPSGAVPTTAQMQFACNDLHVSALLVESTDFVWAEKASWVWTEKPLFANDTVRVFACPLEKQENRD